MSIKLLEPVGHDVGTFVVRLSLSELVWVVAYISTKGCIIQEKIRNKFSHHILNLFESGK